MTNIKEYAVAIGLSPDELSKEVNSKIKEGWMPIGGISFCLRHITTAGPNDPPQATHKQGSVYAQALGK